MNVARLINGATLSTGRIGIQDATNICRRMGNICTTPGEQERAPTLEQVNVNPSRNAAEVALSHLSSQQQQTAENRPSAAENWELSAATERCEGRDGLSTGYFAERSKIEMEQSNLEAFVKQQTAAIVMHMAVHGTAFQAIRARKGARSVRQLYNKKCSRERNGIFRFRLPSAVAVEAGARSSTIYSAEPRHEGDQNCADCRPRSE